MFRFTVLSFPEKHIMIYADSPMRNGIAESGNFGYSYLDSATPGNPIDPVAVILVVNYPDYVRLQLLSAGLLTFNS